MPSDREITELVERFGVEPQSTRGVLLVDDEEMNLRVLRGFLEDDWVIHEASSGVEALYIAEKVPLDVIVADQRMPRMTGVEMLTELRRRRSDIAGIILTAYADMTSMESAINRANVFRFMRKPFEPPDVIQAVAQASADVVHRRTIAKLVQLLARRSDELRRSLDELQIQQQMLLHLERLGTIGKLAAGVTHDLRSLMVAFRAAEWEMQKATIPPALREIVTLGLAGAENMVHTLGTLQEFSRTGKVTLELEAVDPGVVVQDALAIAKMDAVFKLHVVTSEVAPGLPAIRGDRQKLTQVLVNLVRNALHATSPGQKVRVTAQRGDDGVVLAVEDEGPGVAAEIRERLFQPFTSTKGDQGYGLGLYMARLIVVSHRGRIDLVESPRGARFEVVLPATAEGAAVARAP
ncbi:MAG TPA: hybrid sensor histidine kinase/response regulator [Anaeromyxobacter sp.]